MAVNSAPVILERTPYNKNDEALAETAPFFARHGYGVVLQDVRGRFGSEGTWYKARKEGQDGCDTPVILELIDRLPYDPERLAEMFGVDELNLTRREFYRGLALQPTLTINGLVSGYTGKGTKTIIPGRASVKLDMRLVGNQDPLDIFEKLQAHVKEHAPRVEIKHRGPMFPSQTRPDLPVVPKVIEGVRKGAKMEPVVAPAMGGSRPDYVWTRILEIPSVSVPCANADEANHAPNENMEVELFYRAIHISAQVMYELGQEEKLCD